MRDASIEVNEPQHLPWPPYSTLVMAVVTSEKGDWIWKGRNWSVDGVLIMRRHSAVIHRVLPYSTKMVKTVFGSTVTNRHR